MTVYDHPDYRALLAAVRAAPEDDLPRLVLADWLEENGEAARAEFIRVQVELAWREREGLAGQRCDQLKRRELELIGRNVNTDGRGVLPQYFLWLDGIPSHMVKVRGFGLGADAPSDEQSFRRGFVHTVRCTLEDWYGGECGCQPDDPDGRDYLRGHDCPTCHGTGRTTGRTIGHGPAIVRAHPVEVVRLTDRQPMPVSIDPQVAGVIWWGSYYHSEDYIFSPSNLPTEVFSAMDGTRFSRGGYFYPTRDAAHAALSDALLQWALSNTPEDSTR